MDNSNIIVKTFRSVEKLQVRNLTIGKFFSQLFAMKHEVDIPKRITWNGENDSGKVVPDGVYTCVLKAWDDNKMEGESAVGKLNIITITPYISASPSYLSFSPSETGMKTNIAFNIKSSNIITIADVKAEIIDENSNVVKTYDYQGNAPQEITWDGRNSAGTLAGEGLYSFNIRVSDLSGNSADSEIRDILLITNSPELLLTPNVDIFSPAANGIAIFKPVVSNASALDKLDSWAVKISDKSSSTVKVLKGNGNLPTEIVWDGKDDNNLRLPDGVYSYDLELNYESGNGPKSAKNNIEVRSTPPRVVVFPEYTAFSPIEGSKKKTITFSNNLVGRGSDTIELEHSIDSVGNTIYYDKEDLSNFPALFTWNGLDNNLQPLPEGKYSYIIDASDKAGNKSETRVDGITLTTGREKVAVQSDFGAISPVNSTQNQAAFDITGSKDRVQECTFEIKSGNSVVW